MAISRNLRVCDLVVRQVVTILQVVNHACCYREQLGPDAGLMKICCLRVG